MNILLISHYYLNQNYGGTEVLTGAVANYLQSRGHKIYWIASGSHLPILSSKYYLCPITPPSHSRFDIDLFEEEQSAKIERLLQEIHISFDIVYVSHYVTSGLFFIDSPWLQSAKKVLTLTDYSLICPNCVFYSFHKRKICTTNANCSDCGYPLDMSKYLQKYLSFINEKFHLITFQTQTQRHIFMSFGVSAQKILDYSGAYPVFLDWKFAPIARDSTSLQMYFIGRGSPEKGLNVIASSMQYVAYGNVDLHVYSYPDEDTTYWNQFLHLVKSNQNFYYDGVIEYAKLDMIFNRADCIVIPSQWLENYPTIMSYALAWDCPLIISGVPSLKEFSSENTIIIEDYANPEAWGRIISNYYDILKRKKRNNLIANSNQLFHKLMQRMFFYDTFME